MNLYYIIKRREYLNIQTFVHVLDSSVQIRVVLFHARLQVYHNSTTITVDVGLESIRL